MGNIIQPSKDIQPTEQKRMLALCFSTTYEYVAVERFIHRLPINLSEVTLNMRCLSKGFLQPANVFLGTCHCVSSGFLASICVIFSVGNQCCVSCSSLWTHCFISCGTLALRTFFEQHVTGFHAAFQPLKNWMFSRDLPMFFLHFFSWIFFATSGCISSVSTATKCGCFSWTHDCF